MNEMHVFCLFKWMLTKIFLENGMDLDYDVLYNFTNATSQLMRDDGVTPWRDPWGKTFIVLLSFDWCFVETWRHCCEPYYIRMYKSNCFTLIIVFNIISISTNMLSLIVRFIIMYYLFDETLHTWLPQFKVSLPSIGRWQKKVPFWILWLYNAL